jgi:predicted regulator of Ras-like GTPase activity (Roadblock/LC7/MglB family)
MDVRETPEPAKEGKVKTLSEQLVSDPNSLVFASLADMYREEGMMEEALAMCQAGLELHPRHVPGRLILARIHRDANRPLEARAVLEKVLSLEPGNPEALALLQAMEAKPEEPSPVVPVEEISAKPATVVSPVPPLVVQPLGADAGLEIIPETPVAVEPPREEGFKLVPWAEAATRTEAPPAMFEGPAPVVAMPEIERSTTDLSPGAFAKEGFVISHPIDMEFPKEELITAPPASIEPPVMTEEAPLALVEEPALPAPKEEEQPVRVVEIPAGVEVLLHEEALAPPATFEEKPVGELPILPFEESLFAAPSAPPEAPGPPPAEEEPEKPRKEVPLAEFMKSLSESEFLKATPAPLAPVAERAVTEPEVLSDEIRGEMEKALEDLLTLAEVEGAMIVNRDGLVLAERTRAGINAEEAAALGASIFETTFRSIERMHLGQLDRGIVETGSGRLYLTAMGDAMVVLLTRDDTKMGLVLMRMKKVMERVRRVLG